MSGNYFSLPVITAMNRLESATFIHSTGPVEVGIDTSVTSPRVKSSGNITHEYGGGVLVARQGAVSSGIEHSRLALPADYGLNELAIMTTDGDVTITGATFASLGRLLISTGYGNVSIDKLRGGTDTAETAIETNRGNISVNDSEINAPKSLRIITSVGRICLTEFRVTGSKEEQLVTIGRAGFKSDKITADLDRLKRSERDALSTINIDGFTSDGPMQVVVGNGLAIVRNSSAQSWEFVKGPDRQGRITTLSVQGKRSSREDAAYKQLVKRTLASQYRNR